MEYVLTFFYAAVFLFIILKSSFFKTESISPKYFGAVFILKIFVGIILGYLYQIYFNGGDTFAFFSDANKMYEILKSHPAAFFKMASGLSQNTSLEVYYRQIAGWNNYEYFYNDSRTIISINALIRIFSFGYYNVHVVFFCFLSLTGLNGIFKIFTDIAPTKAKEFFLSVFLIPSVLFWNSGILKEGILAFALGLFLYSFMRAISGKRSLKYFLWLGITLLLLTYLKIYILIIVIPGIAAYWWSVKTNYKNVFLKFSIVYLTYFLILFNLKYINPNYNLSEIMYWKQHNTINYARFMHSGSFVEPPRLYPSTKSILKNSPQALLNVFILPNWKYISNPFALVAASENLLIIIIILISVLFYKKLKDYQQPLFFLSFFFVIFLFILIGLTSPILGSMVRYKVPALPFLLSMMMLLFNKEKFKRLIRQ